MDVIEALQAAGQSASVVDAAATAMVHTEALTLPQLNATLASIGMVAVDVLRVRKHLSAKAQVRLLACWSALYSFWFAALAKLSGFLNSAALLVSFSPYACRQLPAAQATVSLYPPWLRRPCQPRQQPPPSQLRPRLRLPRHRLSPPLRRLVPVVGTLY